MSDLLIFPIPALTTGILFCLSKTKRASKLPKESAFTIIPCFSVFIDSEISFLKIFSISSDLKSNIKMQSENVRQIFNERYMTLIGALNNHGFDADLYYNIEDFTKKIALVPCSAQTKIGIPELILMLCGLSQKYLSEKLKLGKDAKGVTLEIKKEKSQSYIEAILYDGELLKKDSIAVASFSGEPIITKIRILEEIQPLSSRFLPKEKVQASTGIRMQIVEKAEILPGMPFVIFRNNKEEIEKIFKKEISLHPEILSTLFNAIKKGVLLYFKIEITSAV